MLITLYYCLVNQLNFILFFPASKKAPAFNNYLPYTPKQDIVGTTNLHKIVSLLF